MKDAAYSVASTILLNDIVCRLMGCKMDQDNEP